MGRNLWELYSFACFYTTDKSGSRRKTTRILHKRKKKPGWDVFCRQNVEEEKDYAAEYNLQESKSNDEKIENNVASEAETKVSEEKAKLSVDEMRNKLKAFRTETAKNMNIPPYYVFNNDEMEKLLELMPKTLDELKALNILPAVKINTHGKRIIEILSS